jgi:protein involved in polysaccharide export with SLBB domain
MRYWALVTCLVIVGGCGPGANAIAPPRNAAADTLLGAGDVFEVRVYGEEDLSSDYRVSQRGDIDFPYVGSIQVAELEPSAVAHLIETRLREGEVLVNPQVSVLVTEYNSKRVSVTGAVRNPGTYSIPPGTAASQAIGLAGGTTDLANRDGAIITRRINGVARRYALPLDRITIGAAEDTDLQNGDIIYVPERPF